MNLFNSINLLATPEWLTEACDDNYSNLLTIFKFIKAILALVQIVVPIILIIVGAFDLAKAVMGSDEKEIKAATQKLIKRAIAAVCVFFLSTIVTVVMSYVSDSGGFGPNTELTWIKCWNAAKI